MLVLQAGEEQEQTFQKLIQTMGEQIVWEGRFIVKDDELILEGTVRSLIFQFETKKVFTNLVDIPVKEDRVLDVSRHPKIRDLVNMVLYAFGKWGTLRGLRVEQDYPQLNQLFAKILSMYYIEPSFRKENFRFYKVGVRITYEEVLQTVLEFEKKQEEDPFSESQGLWHTLIWKNRQRSFQKTETTLAERSENRIGSNFYLVGYQCPKCAGKLFMAVYPDGKEMRIDTEEKGVYLARVYTCDSCNSFYTPRPDRLIYEGLIYEMAFHQDKKAYEDYLELLGHNAERAANFKYNEYEAVRNLRLERERRKAAGLDAGSDDSARRARSQADYLKSPQDALRQMEEFARNAAKLPDDVFRRFAHRVEEGFYPDAAVAKHEKKILEQSRQLDAKEAAQRSGQEGTDSTGRSGRDGDFGKAGMPQGKNGGPDAAARSRMLHNGDSGTGSAAGYGLRKDKNSAVGTGGILQNTADAENGQHGNSRIQPGTGTGQPDKSRTQLGTGTRQPGAAGAQPETSGMGAGQTGSAGTGMTQPETMETDTGQPDARPGSVGMLGPGALRSRNAARQAEEIQDGSTSADAQQASLSPNMERYQARLGVLERLSDRQRRELKRQIRNDASLSALEKQALAGRIEQLEFEEQAKAVLKKAESGAHKSYAQMKGFLQEVEKEPYPDSIKRPVLEKLHELRKRRGEEEVRRIMETVSTHLDREGYQKLEQKLKEYEGIDLSPYTERLRSVREAAEKQEIANMVKRSRKLSRGDYVGLMRRLEEKQFADENLAPYMEKIEERVRKMDEERIQELLGMAQGQDFNALVSVYEQLDAESFLPELKNDTLEMIAKRLEKIRTDECELLVQKLQDEMAGTIKENARHHFYPARKVMLKRASPEETSTIDAALSAYAAGRSRFEYPVFAADTSRNHSGREGMLLTPDNLYYGTRMNSYEIPVTSIASIEASTGLLNRKITLEETNGARHKLPYAVGTGEMEDWAQILQDFVRYLQEKPPSRKLPYLAKETHDTICCYRCGYIYKERDVCPECGYKKNR